MDSYHISGGHKIEGEYRVSGAKNAVLPILAASLISGDESIILNCPDLSDVNAMLRILEYLGCKTKFSSGVITVDSSGVNRIEIPEDMMHEMRSSIFIMGPMLAKYRRITLSYPGGCEIGARPIDIHLKALRQLGVDIEEHNMKLTCKADSLIGTEITFDFPSVGATENLMMTATAAQGETKLINAAREPEIVNLQNFLNSKGANIRGAGSDTIYIGGSTKWDKTEFATMPDRIEAGTIMAAAAVTGGRVILDGASPEDMKSITEVFIKSGCLIREEANRELSRIEITAPKRLKAIEQITTLPHPGFPTDMQAQVGAMMTLANGKTRITETIFENRFKYSKELEKMGAKVHVQGDTLEIEGVERLMGAELDAYDLRGGAALTVAALAAEGRSIVNNIVYVDRGYEKLELTLKNLGAEIVRKTKQQR